MEALATMPLPMPGMGWMRQRASSEPPDCRNQRRKLASTSDVVCLDCVVMAVPIECLFRATGWDGVEAAGTMAALTFFALQPKFSSKISEVGDKAAKVVFFSTAAHRLTDFPKKSGRR